ncbi:MAG: GGDEF domain-containing phosphodiesterase [Lachnospiraceae bacterium]|nr:GGDEF domain-containing phosphodiesterase [Lachnospiraceae bacterium]
MGYRFMNGTDNLLRFVRKLGMDAKATITSLTRAVAMAAPDYHIARLEIDLSEVPAFLPNAKTRLMTLYEAPNPPEENGEALLQRFHVTREGEILVSIYPGPTPWTETEKDELVIFSHICFFYFGRIRFADVVEKSAFTQYLSGLPNAGGYISRVMPIVAQRRITEYDAYYFNLRSFGLISRRYGAGIGDQVIRKYAEILRVFRAEDEVIGHLGGDNFVALIRKENSPAFLEMLSGISVTVPSQNGPVTVQLSAVAGGWHITDNQVEQSDLISMPGIALNIAKNVTHQSACFVTEEMVKRVSEEKQVMQLFPKALAREEFVVYYQPKVDSRTNELTGAEGLVRWKHDGETISPGLFIPVLEREGEIEKLDLYVLRRVCEDLVAWQKAGLKPVQISVNISRKDLSDPGLASEIDVILSTYGIDRSLIQIEVTETTDETEHGKMTEFLNRLYEMNISTAIDDFGSGYSSLSTLRNFRIGTLKIDRSFINNEEFSKNDEIILTDIIHMAGRLGIGVITEGVERTDQLEFVNRVGCYVIQGFLYDRPLPRDEFEKRLENRKYEA